MDIDFDIHYDFEDQVWEIISLNYGDPATLRLSCLETEEYRTVNREEFEKNATVTKDDRTPRGDRSK